MKQTGLERTEIQFQNENTAVSMNHLVSWRVD